MKPALWLIAVALLLIAGPAGWVVLGGAALYWAFFYVTFDALDSAPLALPLAALELEALGVRAILDDRQAELVSHGPRRVQAVALLALLDRSEQRALVL